MVKKIEGNKVWEVFGEILRRIRGIWYRVVYKATPLSMMTALAAQHDATKSAETEIRWVPSVKISGVLKHGLLTHPPARVSFRCRVPRRGRFQTFVACIPEASDRSRRNIEFAVEIALPGNCPPIVCREKIYLKRNLQPRKWQEVNVRLHRFAEQDVDLTLTTAISGNCSEDRVWSVWGDPILLDCKPIREIWADVRNFVGAYGLIGLVVESMKLLFWQVVRDRGYSGEAGAGRPFATGGKTGNDLVMGKKDVGFADLSYERRKIAVYINSRGNYFFREIGQLLFAGLKEIGCSVDLRNENDGFARDVDWHIVIAPHEFFYLGGGIKLQHLGLPNNLIILNTEQPSTQWFSKAYRIFPSAHTIWDINPSVCELIRSKGFDCSHLALGYVTGFEPLQEVRELPRNDGTSSLTTEVLRQSYLNAPLAQRPIDVLFVGYLSPRRAKFFSEAASVFSAYRCYFHFSDGTAPVRPGHNTYMDTLTAVGLAQRTKIVLNIHHGEDKYFEWHRVVMHGLWQKALVVSETADVAPPFEAGRDFVSTGLDTITEQITFYLSSVEGQQRAQTIADCGYLTLTEKCRLSECLRPLLAGLQFEAAAAPVPVHQISM